MNATRIPPLEEYGENAMEKTTIIATDVNSGLIATFLEANSLTPGAELSTYRKVLLSSTDEDCIVTEKYYNAICIKYNVEDLHIGILLLNLSAKHHGLNNMLVDYLKRLNVQPISVDERLFTKPVTMQEVNTNFLTNVVPKLKNSNLNKLPIHKHYVEDKE